MAINVAGEIEKEFKTEFDDILSIYFGFNNIEIKPKITLKDKIYFLINTAFVVTFLIFILLLNQSFIFFTLLSLMTISSLLYNYYRLLDKVTIDFSHKEILLHNKLWIVNHTRKMFGKKLTLPFTAISHFEVQYSRYSFFSPTYSRLLVKSPDYLPFLIGSFQVKDNARKLGDLLQLYITGKEKVKTITKAGPLQFFTS